MSIVQEVERFAAEHLIGRERELDVPAEDPLQHYAAYHALGINNWWLPSDVGGRGISMREGVDIVSALAYADAGFAFTTLISILGTTFVDVFGSAEQRERYLRPLASGARYAAAAASEREAGSELLRMATSAEKTERGYVLDGPKFFCTNAGFAELVVVVARVPGRPSPTHPSERGRDDFKAFVVEKGNVGLRIVRRWSTIGLRSSATYELSFSRCAVADEAVLAGNGLRCLEVALNPSRILIAAIGIGLAMRLRDVCLDYAQTKSVRDASLLSNSNFIGRLGQIEMQIEAIRMVCRAAASELDEALRDRARLVRVGVLKSAVVAKMLSGQLTWDIASTASQALGGLGFTEDSLVGKLVRDARIISIIEAGDDVLREYLFQRHILPGMSPR